MPKYTKLTIAAFELLFISGFGCEVSAGALPVSKPYRIDQGLLLTVNYRRNISPWNAPYHTSDCFRDGPTAALGLIAQGIINPWDAPHALHAASPYNYYYYPNYRFIYGF